MRNKFSGSVYSMMCIRLRVVFDLLLYSTGRPENKFNGAVLTFVTLRFTSRPILEM